MIYGSVCSGIEAATVAWHPLGWRPAWFSEIEAFPCAVLAYHYSNVPNLGDMRRFKEWPDAALDLLVGGTPCQSFSVAGLRKGLADPRGNLMLTYLAIAARYRPRWLVWENVPGVLSADGGRAFGTLLGGWRNSGMGSHTAFLTLSTSEWNHTLAPSLNDDGVCSLSDILEIGDHLQRYFLSAKACVGILRRAAKRGKELPEPLQRALAAVADSGQISI
nr:DNA cytosine methyltransferase [Paraburkholderia sacchari]